MQNRDDLTERVAVVTGGGGGIGLATVRRLLSTGARVALWDLREPEDLDAIADGASRERLLVSTVDVREPETIARAADAALTRWSRIDILVNNAGTTIGHKPTADLPGAVWRALIETNLSGAFHCVQALVPTMAERGWGRVINITSVLAEFGYPGHAAYVASKSGLAGVTRSWAREFGPSGVTVNAVRPGYIRTAMNARNPADVERQVAAMTPLRRLGEPDDVAGAIAWLCSADASFVTGAVIGVDGGLIT